MIQRLDELLCTLKVLILPQLEILPIDHSYILGFCQFLQIPLQGTQLEVLPLIKRQNRNPIIQLKRIRIRGVINQHHVLQVSVQASQVLHMELVGEDDTMWAVESVGEDLVLRVQLVEDSVRVGLVARCEDYNLVLFRHSLQKRHHIRTDIDSHLHVLPLNVHAQRYIRHNLQILITMNQRLVQIQHQNLAFSEVSLQPFHLKPNPGFGQQIRVNILQARLDHLDGTIDVLNRKGVLLI